MFLPFLKRLRNRLLTEYIILNSSVIVIACRHKANMSSCLILTSTGLFLFKSFKERGVQKSVFQNCFKTNQIGGSDDCKVFHGKY